MSMNYGYKDRMNSSGYSRIRNTLGIRTLCGKIERIIRDTQVSGIFRSTFAVMNNSIKIIPDTGESGIIPSIFGYPEAMNVGFRIY